MSKNIELTSFAGGGKRGRRGARGSSSLPGEGGCGQVVCLVYITLGVLVTPQFFTLSAYNGNS